MGKVGDIGLVRVSHERLIPAEYNVYKEAASCGVAFHGKNPAQGGGQSPIEAPGVGGGRSPVLSLLGPSVFLPPSSLGGEHPWNLSSHPKTGWDQKGPSPPAASSSTTSRAHRAPPPSILPLAWQAPEVSVAETIPGTGARRSSCRSAAPGTGQVREEAGRPCVCFRVCDPPPRGLPSSPTVSVASGRP